MEDLNNRVANSSLITIDIEEYIDKSPRELFDIRNGFTQGLILREKDFRDFVKSSDWSVYTGKNIGIYCSEDSIVPSWAYMLVVSKLRPIARSIYFGNELDLEKGLIDEAINEIMNRDFRNAKVVIKGCGEIINRDYAYVQLSKRLIPFVSSMMYGEPCSTVPVYKSSLKK